MVLSLGPDCVVVSGGKSNSMALLRDKEVVLCTSGPGALGFFLTSVCVAAGHLPSLGPVSPDPTGKFKWPVYLDKQ